MIGSFSSVQLPHTSAELPCSRIAEIARQRFSVEGALVIEPMTGGASTRRYARLVWGDAHTAVVMFVPEATRSEEFSKGDISQRRWPFLEVAELLSSRGIRVPRILAEVCPEGIVLLEDLGDNTLAAFLEEHPEQKTVLYQQAVADLAHAQQALVSMPDDSIVLGRAFDRDLLHWEVEHFREWALDAQGYHLSEADSVLFSRVAEYLATTIAALPRGFVHRDYQSRNLMVRPNGDGSSVLVWIDFQDALLGPRVYDLVALLGDSYQSFDREFIEARLDEFARICGYDTAERKLLGYEFDLVTVQRKLKDAGRFVFIDRVKKNPSFLKFVTPTIGKVHAALSRLTEEPLFCELEEMLARVLR